LPFETDPIDGTHAAPVELFDDFADDYRGHWRRCTPRCGRYFVARDAVNYRVVSYQLSGDV